VLYSDLTKNLSPHTKHHVSRPYLDDLEEHGRSVADGLGEDLQQRALVVAVDQDPELHRHQLNLQLKLVRAHPAPRALVVVVALTI
jgi:hypothetical protein